MVSFFLNVLYRPITKFADFLVRIKGLIFIFICELLTFDFPRNEGINKINTGFFSLDITSKS